jgi:hypothetical protein
MTPDERDQSPAKPDPINWDLLRGLIEAETGGCLDGVLERMAASTSNMSREEAVIRLLMDLPRA